MGSKKSDRQWVPSMIEDGKWFSIDPKANHDMNRIEKAARELQQQAKQGRS